MTIYALDLNKVQHTIRETLVNSVLPAIESDSARGELHAVIEMLDNLDGRLAWAEAPLSESVSQTRALAALLGRDVEGDGLEALRSGRVAIGDVLASAYADGSGPEIARAVAEFTAADVTSEISRGLLPGLPD
ncbi:hypothetical protein [Mycobacterium sp. ACS4331]|uniref:hypothetical protein n=1 Tax=Mycobacterium sp. ACS4331 TaxID=1834121 RepID=UPI0007FC742D|nr:hypothetical protein [Mycobacterium sp. ACS4331]OBF21573.1 hypothetical protein A5727_08870 [Mycobacterium sp. ACS4331]